MNCSACFDTLSFVGPIKKTWQTSFTPFIQVFHWAQRNAEHIIPLYCFDPRHYQGTHHFNFPKTGPFRLLFLLDSVRDLRATLKKRGRWEFSITHRMYILSTIWCFMMNMFVCPCAARCWSGKESRRMLLVIWLSSWVQSQLWRFMRRCVSEWPHTVL